MAHSAPTIGAKSGYISRFNTAKGESHPMNNFVLAAFVAAIITPIIASITKWLVPNYFGRNFRDLVSFLVLQM